MGSLYLLSFGYLDGFGLVGLWGSCWDLFGLAVGYSIVLDDPIGFIVIEIFLFLGIEAFQDNEEDKTSNDGDTEGDEGRRNLATLVVDVFLW